MKRLTAYLCALALAWAPMLTPASTTLMGAGKIAVVAGGGSLAFDTAVDYAVEDATELTSASSMTIATTANRWAIGGMLSRDSAAPPPGAHVSMKLGGSAGTSITPQLGSTTDINGLNTVKVSRWGLAWNSGTTGSQTCYGDIDAPEPVLFVACAVYNGVHQTTPVVSTPTATVGFFESPATSTVASITGTTVSGNILVVVLSIQSTDSGAVTVACTGENVRTEEHLVLNKLVIVDRTATGASTTVDCTLSVGAAGPQVDWRMDGYVIQAP